MTRTASGAVLDRALEALDLTVEPETRSGLQRYIETVERWNRTMNLTALAGDALAQRLVAEPLWVARRLSPRGAYLDIGSGNGSPAFPWLLAADFTHAALVEARGRRAVFLRRLSHALRLPAVSIHAVRFDDFVPEGRMDWITLQGVRLTPDLWAKIARRVPGARIVWFSRRGEPPAAPSDTLEIPHSDRCAMVFQI